MKSAVAGGMRTPILGKHPSVVSLGRHRRNALLVAVECALSVAGVWGWRGSGRECQGWDGGVHVGSGTLGGSVSNLELVIINVYKRSCYALLRSQLTTSGCRVRGLAFGRAALLGRTRWTASTQS